jgi:hypothetical protein
MPEESLFFSALDPRTLRLRVIFILSFSHDQQPQTPPTYYLKLTT